MKQILNKIVWIFLLLYLFLFLFYPMYSNPRYFVVSPDGPPPIKNLHKVYFDFGDYKVGEYGRKHYIWDKLDKINICNEKIGCFNGKILRMEGDENILYIYYEFNNYLYNSLDDFLCIYNHYCEKKDLIEIEDKNIPEYFILDSNGIIFYSKNKLVNLSKEEQKIFMNLQNNY